MPTLETFYTQPVNLDGLIKDLRVNFGDIAGSVYSDTIMRTALVNAVKYLQKRWDSKYQIYSSDIKLLSQPVDTPSGYIAANVAHGLAYIPNSLIEGDVFRDPYLEYTQPAPPIIESEDEMGIILAAVYLLRKAQISSSSESFVSWRTEDVSWSNLGASRSLDSLLQREEEALNKYFKSRLGKPKILQFAINYLPYF